MAITNFPRGVSSFGIPLFGSGPIFTTGTVRWVHSGIGTNDNNGLDPDRPFATIDAAINASTATSSTHAGEDFVVAMPGHAETISGANGFDIDVAGVTVLGLGRGTLRPTLTYSATASTIAVGANGTALINFLHVASINAVVTMMDIQATTGFLLEANEFRDAASIGITDTITLTDEVDLVLRNNRFYETDTGVGQSCILGTTPLRLVIDGNYFHKDAQTGIIENGNATVLQVVNNYIRTLAAEDLAIVSGSTATGWIDNNMIRLQDDAFNITEAITITTNIQLGRNWVVNADEQRVIEHNAVQSTDS